MPTKAELLAEAYRRDLLPPEKRKLYEEAVKRGVIKDEYANSRLKGRDTPFGFASGLAARFNEAVPGMDEVAAFGTTLAQTARRGIQGEYQIKRGNNALQTLTQTITPIMDQEWKRAREHQLGLMAGARDRSPAASGAATGAGYVAQALVPAGQAVTVPNRVAGMARGAGLASMQSGVNALTGRGTAQERLADAGSAMTNPAVLALGAGFGALAPTAPKPVKPQTARQADVAALEDIGVQTSIPQRIGGAAKNAEDLTKRVPVVGDAVRGMRDRQIEQFNRGIALSAVEDIGGTIPKTVKPGFEMVQMVDDQIGKVYDDALALVPSVRADQQLLDDLAAIEARNVDLTDESSRLFEKSIMDRFSRLSRDGVTGKQVKLIHEELGELAAVAAKKGDDILSGMYTDARRAVLGIVERSNPEAAAMIQKADGAWAKYSVLNDAAAAANARGGVFLPSQLSSQSRRAAQRLGSNMAGKGQGTFQREATAGVRVLSDQYGNPGTANALIGFGAGGGLSAGLSGALGPEAQAASVLTAAGGAGVATPYFLAARKVLEQLPRNANEQQVRGALVQLQELSAKDPSVRAIAERVAAMLPEAAPRAIGAAGGAQAAASSSPR